MKARFVIFLTCGLTAFSLGISAQDFDYTIKSTEISTIKIRISRSELKLSGSSSKGKISIHANEFETSNDIRAEGLTPVTPWPENTGVGFHISEENGIISIIKTNGNVEGKYEISIPKNANVEIEETEWYGGSFDIQNLSGNLTMKSNTSNITLKNVSGSIHVKSTSGEINADLTSLSSGYSHKIATVSGTINLIILEQAPLSLKLETISGAIHTDFDVKMEKEYKGSTLYRIGNLRKAEVDLNGGGDRIKATSVSGLVKVSFAQ